ncbi:hypothetical protein, partial [Pseudoalteromonas sp. SWN29]|uniref:hypothetical protein n=1 Tax=Pseudoalteromonas sp. SWN29 TaxID=2792064 RepID=UPI001E598C07
QKSMPIYERMEEIYTLRRLELVWLIMVKICGEFGRNSPFDDFDRKLVCYSTLFWLRNGHPAAPKK